MADVRKPARERLEAVKIRKIKSRGTVADALSAIQIAQENNVIRGMDARHGVCRSTNMRWMQWTQATHSESGSRGIGSDAGRTATRCPNRRKFLRRHHESGDSRRRYEDIVKAHDENTSARRAVKTCRALFRYRKNPSGPGALPVRYHLCHDWDPLPKQRTKSWAVPGPLETRPWMAILRPHFWWQDDARSRPANESL